MPARAQREKSTLNEAIKTEIKQRWGGGSVVLSVQEYDTHMHKAHTGRAMPGLSPPWDMG